MYQRWLAAFHAVARSGGFTAAAKAMNIGQPTVSSHVGMLEDHFEVELFHRRGRRIQITPIGNMLLTITDGLFGHETEAVELLRAAKAREIGSLKIGALRTADVMEIGAYLLKQHPHLQLSVTIKPSPYILDGLLKFDLDVGVVSDQVPDSRFFSFFYNRYRINFVAHRDHPLAKRRSIKIRELEGQRFLQRPKGSSTRTAVDQALDKAGVKVRHVMEISDRAGVRGAVLQGIGIGAWSESEMVEHPQIKVLPVSNAEMFSYSYVVCLSERRERPLIANFLQHAKESAGRIRKVPKINRADT